MQYGTGGQGPNETRNLIIACALAVAIFVGFDFFYAGPQRARLQAAEQARAEQQHQAQQQASQQAGSAAPAPGTPAAVAAVVSRDQALAATASARVAIASPAVQGSISLQGARLDDLSLNTYCRTMARAPGGRCTANDDVTLLQPINSTHGLDAFLGWQNQDARGYGIGVDDVWSAPAGAQLTPETPLTLTIRSQDGFEVTRVLSIDANYMITAVDTVHNAGAAPISIRPFGVVRRQGLPEDYVNRSIVQQGFAGVFGPHHLETRTYHDGDKHVHDRAEGKVGEDQRLFSGQGDGGWLGISDHYWLTAVVAPASEHISGYYDARQDNGGPINYRAAYTGQYRTIPAGGSITYTQRVFSGAKRVDLLRDYQSQLNIPRFDEAVDWGNITWILSRTFFLWLLHPLATWVAGLHMGLPAFGIAILLSTIVIKAAMFPLVYQSFKAMGKMRALQPKMKELQERYAADKQRQQQELLKLYQTEKVNPVSGCIPMLLQIPVFFALYKTLSVTIEMRQAPFVGWVHDLSAQDPTTIFNIFGLLPFNPHDIPVIGGLLPMVGVWAVLYGVSMFALQSLSPPPADPTQAQIFRFMPILFTLLFAGFPAGLVIYWTWSNTLTMAQQYIIMRRQGTETQFDKWIKRMRERLQGGAAPAE